MATIVEGMRFTFQEDWNVSKYDEWGYYRNQFLKVCGGAKAIDVLALEPGECCWLVEIKDYRQHVRTKAVDLADEVAVKVRDTLAGLVGAQYWATDDAERNSARQALRVKNLKVVLHLEQPTRHSKLFPRAIDPATVLQRLKQLIKPIDPHPRVVEKQSLASVPWDVM